MVAELVKGVCRVGVSGPGIRNFYGHDFTSHRGTTCNVHFIVKEFSSRIKRSQHSS